MRIFAVLVGVAMTLPVWAGDVAVIQSNNYLGFKLVRESLKNEKKLKNTIVSPISAHFALSMALNGSANSTKSQFLSLLGYSQTTLIEGINGQNQSVLDALAPPVLSIKNSAWSTNGATDGRKYNFKQSFAKTLADYYQVKNVSSLDFKNKKTADVINNWTKNATNGMIPEIIDSDTLSQLLWVLLNTTYLEAKWEKPFNEPRPLDFALFNGQKVKVPTMSRMTRSRYFSNSDVQVAEVSIINSSLNAYVVLPQNQENFVALQNSDTGIWSDSYWKTILSQLSPSYGILTMPKFTFDYGVTLMRDQPMTKAIGLNFLFQDTADFSNMDGEGSPSSRVGIIKQNSKIEWNENGVKAAAATLVGGATRSMSPPPQITMVVDRPFYFAIYDEATGAFLFLGQVVDPR